MGGQAEDCEQKRREKATTLLQEPWTVTHLDQLTLSLPTGQGTQLAFLVQRGMHPGRAWGPRHRPETENCRCHIYIYYSQSDGY
jgi:hypothetical protein